MTRQFFGAAIIALGWVLVTITIGIQIQMQLTVARLAPPKTDQPFQNLWEALSQKRIRREYERLYPDSAKRKLLWMRAISIAAAVCILIGVVLVR
jgi:hypothetical protein